MQDEWERLLCYTEFIPLPPPSGSRGPYMYEEKRVELDPPTFRLHTRGPTHDEPSTYRYQAGMVKHDRDGILHEKWIKGRVTHGSTASNIGGEGSQY
jgi:hypothetical protein